MLLTVNEVSKILRISIPMGYKVIKKLNDELKAKNYLTISGKVEKSYLYKRYGITEDETVEN